MNFIAPIHTDRADGDFIGGLLSNDRHDAAEEFKGNTRVFTVSQLGLAKPNPHPLVKIVFTKKKAPSSVK